MEGNKVERQQEKGKGALHESVMKVFRKNIFLIKFCNSSVPIKEREVDWGRNEGRKIARINNMKLVVQL